MNNRIVFAAIAAAITLSGCGATSSATTGAQSATGTGRTVEVGGIAVFESFDLNARLSSDDVQPRDYTVWMWENRNDIPLAEGVRIDYVAYTGDGGAEIWRTSTTSAIHRADMPRELALQAGLFCAEVHGYMITHAALIGERGNGVYTSCSYQLPGDVRSGGANGGFGIPVILVRKGVTNG
jgi:hypothetical protein